MKRIRRILGISHRPDAGFSLIEVLVAMMVFAIISVGIAFGITNTLVMTRTSRASEAATNLAAQEIDLDRAVADVFTLGDTVKHVTQSGLDFTLTRTVDWVTSEGAASACGVGGGTLQYKKVTVTVGWQGQTSGTPDVQSSTLIAPGDRINDPTKGTIIIDVTSASGAGLSGVAVKVTPSSVANGATSLTAQPATTDAEGCSFALGVTPGNYDVTISQAGSLDIQQNATPTKTVGVAAGGSGSAGFTFDQSALYTVDYAANVTGTTPMVPSDLTTSFAGTAGGVAIEPASAGNPFALYPAPDGYRVLAGSYVAPAGTDVGCVDVDPASWKAGDGGTDPTAPPTDPATPPPGRPTGQPSAPAGPPPGQALTPVAAPPGGTVSVDVPMGVAAISSSGTLGVITAVQQTAAPSGTYDPGCAHPQTYTFRSVNGKTATIALPFGSWALYASGGGRGQSTVISGSSVSPKTNGSVDGNVITFDPRQAG